VRVSEDEFTAFCDAVYPRLVGALTLTCGGQRAVAEEVCQDALARAYRDWHRIRGYDNPAAWVRRVAVNLATSRFRRWQAERRAQDRLVITTETKHDDPDVAMAIAVGQTLERLTPDQRVAVVLRYYLDLPISEVAEITGRSQSAVTSLTSRALDVLRIEFGVNNTAPDEEALHP
jgi:RNA polymerase sigma-70 factor, ECF subfamily